MKKTCVFIIGTNAVGKSTTAKEIIKLLGGIKQSGKWITTTNDKHCCFAGKYSEDNKYDGIDCWKETKPLRKIVESAFANYDVIFCEGSYVNSVGANLTNAMFLAENRVVVFLYAPLNVIRQRLKQRSNSDITEHVIKKQEFAMRSAARWRKIGVNVYSIDTSKISAENCAKMILKIVGYES